MRRLLLAIRRFLVEFDEAHEHARTGHPPQRLRLEEGGRRNGRKCHQTS